MTERCRHLSCEELATQQGVVETYSLTRRVFYCDQHMASAARQIALTPGTALTHVEPIEKGTTMDKDLAPEGAVKEKKRMEALVSRVHARASGAEDTGDDDFAEALDSMLEELGLPSRKKHFHLVFTVPVQIRVEGDYTSKEAMREAFKTDQIKWEASDYEKTLDDDIEIVMIEEAQQ